jgi:hypothetical protein
MYLLCSRHSESSHHRPAELTHLHQPATTAAIGTHCVGVLDTANHALPSCKQYKQIRHGCTANSSASDFLPFSEVAPKPAQEEVIFHPTPQQQPQALAAGESTQRLQRRDLSSICC